MTENVLIVKPEFDSEIEAKITSLGEITSNFKSVKEKAIEIKKFYSTVCYSEDQLETAKKDRANINRYKKSVSDYRIKLNKEFNKPFFDFEILAKETEKILEETANSIGTQINDYEDIKRKVKVNDLISYFNEYAASLGIDFVTYDQMGLKVTLSESEKKLQEEIRKYLDNIAKDIELINTQEYADEILIEYKDGLDIRNAITKVNMRKQMLRVNKNIEQAQKNFVENLNKVTYPTEEEIKQVREQGIIPLQKPVEETIEIEEIKQTTFVVKGTMSQLKNLKRYIEENGMEIVK